MRLPVTLGRYSGHHAVTDGKTSVTRRPSALATQAVGEIVCWRPVRAVASFWFLILVWYPLFNKNQATWNYLVPNRKSRNVELPS